MVHLTSLFDQALQCHQRNELAQAEQLYRQILQTDPGHAAACSNLGVLLYATGRTEEALACFERAVQLNPYQPEAHNNLGNALKDQGRPAAAVECYRQALLLEPHNATYHHNLGVAFKEQGLYEAAAAAHEQGLRIDPGFPQARLNRGLLALLHGDFEKGWPDYEYRWIEQGTSKRPFTQPRWTGEPLAGKTILLHAEQGLGDTVQFIRYAPLVKQQGGQVVFECQTALVPLMRQVAGVDIVVPRGQPLPAFDVHAPLLSLPGILRTTAGDIPGGVGYVAADSVLVERWGREIKVADGSPLNVGIVWQGSFMHKYDRYRSVPLTIFESLAKVEGVRLVSLQVGPAARQTERATFPVLDLGSRFDTSSLSDLAAVLVNLDLVVMVDTAAAHLAGALGMPVWIALPFVPDWRWQLEREDSPWYPTMRLFRQHRLGDWGDVFERIAAAIRPDSANRG